MKKGKFVLSPLVLSIILCCSSCQYKETPPSVSGFTLTGKLTGFPDSTWMYLQTGTGKRLDSTMVLNGNISLQGKLPDSVKMMQVILRAKDLHDYKMFWIENEAITITGESGKFRYSKVEGSKAQIESDRFDSFVEAFDKKVDSLGRIARDPAFDPSGMQAMRDTISSIFEKRNAASIDFIRSNPKSFISANVLNIMATSWGKETAGELYASLSQENKDSDNGKQIKRYLDLNKNPEIGEKYVDIEEPDLNNKLLKLSSFEGKVVLLEFWASWCGPCRQENPSLVETYKTFKDKGFAIYAVALDNDKDRWIKAISEDGLPWNHVSDLKGPGGTGSLVYGINAIPDNFLIGRDGVIVARNLRGDELKKKLAELL